MTNDLTTTFTPHHKDGGIDTRCREDMRQIFQGVSATTLEGLSKFRNEKQRIENEYGRYAFELAIAFLQHIKHIDATEKWDSSTNRFKWRAKVLLRSLREGLQELGFKPSNVSTLIGAAKYTIDSKPSDFSSDFDNPDLWERDCKYYRWLVEDNSITARYVLSRTDLNNFGFGNEGAWEDLRRISNEFTEAVPRKELEAIRKRHPLNVEETRGQRSTKSLPAMKVVNDDVSTTTEQILYETQADIQNKFFMCLEQMDLNEAYADPQFMARLRAKTHEIETLKSWLPNRLRPTLSTLN